MAAADEDRQTHLLAEEQRRAERDRWSDDAIDREPMLGRRGARRLLWVALAVLLVVLLVTLPPLINVNRYQRRVASAIAGSIGRPVRFDSIELHLLPLPGFTIHNFVVLENGAFGAEPAMRANTVEARIRFASLWRRRVEISRIRLQSPSVNLVRNAAGFWNLQGVVSQAAQVRSAPTAQARAGDAPRFPYVEATDARINLKLGETKLPYSLTDAEFALWLPNPQEWHLRLAGRPMRTDTDASDVGTLRVEAILGRTAATTAQQPLKLQASWKPTPLGEASKLAVGNDAGWRGSVSAELHADGSPAMMRVTTDVHLRDLRRAEFVPPQAMDMDAHCAAQAIGIAHQLREIRCALPTAIHGSLLDDLPFFRTSAASIAPDVLTLKADMPNVADWHSAAATITLDQGSVAWALQWMRLFSTRMATATEAGGSFSLRLERDPLSMGDGWTGRAVCACTLPAPAGSTAKQPTAWIVRAVHPEPLDPPMAPAAELIVVAGPNNSPAASPALLLAADRLLLPAPVTSTDSVLTSNAAETTVHYPNPQTARQLARVVPALQDDLPTTLVGPVVSTRRWGQPQTWSAASPAPQPSTHRHPRHR